VQRFVVGRGLERHGHAPNVFMTGAAQYPQNPGANPTGMLAAPAYMAGDAINDQYFKAPGQIVV